MYDCERWLFFADTGSHGAHHLSPGTAYQAGFPRCGAVLLDFARQDNRAFCRDGIVDVGSLVFHVAKTARDGVPSVLLSPIIPAMDHDFLLRKSSPEDGASQSQVGSSQMLEPQFLRQGHSGKKEKKKTYQIL